ncbi:MAG: DUF4870 domain-containing protein [Candidatus Omnitrophica bacterium]|nr:DUF4870 domain-containing protein [Candidatus Omnitrophota bacterium]
MPEENVQKMPPKQPDPDSQARTMAMLCHLSALSGYLVPLGNIIGPLVVWLINKDRFPLVEAEGKKALNFHISMIIYTLVSIVLCFLLIGFVLLAAIGIFVLIMIIVASVKTSNGEEFNYPLAIKFLK